MKDIIDAIHSEGKSYRYPDLKPFTPLNEAKNEVHTHPLKEYIKKVTDAEEKGSIYGTLGFLGRICKKDQSSYILDQLDLEKSKKTIDAALISMTGLQVPIFNNYKRLTKYLKEKNSKVRQSAISAMQLCTPDWLEAEQELIKHYENTTNKWDKFWCILTFEEVGTEACLPILQKAINDITDGDGVCFLIKAANRIAPASMTDLYLKTLKSRKDSFTKGLAMKGLYLGKDFSALEDVWERAKKILKKKTNTPNIDHLDGCSEIQAAIMYLKLFENKDARLPDFFKWVKEKKLGHMDYQTQEWVKKNL